MSIAESVEPSHSDRFEPSALFVAVAGLAERAGDGPPLLSGFDAAAHAVEVVELGRRAAAVCAVDVMEAVHRSGVWRDQGHTSARVMVAHLSGMSGSEAFRLDRVRRMVHSEQVATVAEAWRAGRLSVDRAFVLAKVFANPRTRERFCGDQDWFVAQAKKLGFKKFERRVARWVELADEDGPTPQPDPSHRNRDATLVQDHFSKAWHLQAQLGSADGSRFNEIFDAYVEAEFRTDWANAETELGPDTTRDLLARTDRQRRADALVQMAEDAAANPNTSVPVKRVHNLVWTAETAEELFRRWAGAPAQPLSADAPGVTDLDGNAIHSGDAFADLITGTFRRVVQSPASVTIDLSDKHRFFTGLARLGAELQANECYWPGCDQPVSRCQIDHLKPAARSGRTTQLNGHPACGFHNRRKEAGYAVTRQPDGTIQITTPTGNNVR